MYLYDIQTHTQLLINSAISNTELPTTCFVEGLSSGATGFAVSSGGNSTTITLSDTSGTFIAGEELRFGTGVTRSVRTVTAFSLDDVKSVYQDASALGLQTDFTADVVLKTTVIKELGVGDEVNINGSSVLTCAGKTFGSLKIGDILILNNKTDAAPRFNRISAISTDLKQITLAAVPSVTGVCVGTALNNHQSTGFHVARPAIVNNEESGLYATIDQENISDVSLANADLSIKSQMTSLSTNAVGTMTVQVVDVVGVTTAFFEPFDAERYSVHYSDGSVEDLTSDQFTLSNNSTTATITGLTASQSNVVLNVTARKNSVQSKAKEYLRSQKIQIDKCVSAASTVNGLTQNNHFGLRVDDAVISLNTAEVANVVGVFESVTTSAPVLDRLTFVSGLGLDTNSILGERIVASGSGAIAQITDRVSATVVEIAYLTQDRFIIGESVTFEESNITTNLQNITEGSYLNITTNYKLNRGEKEQYSDYSRIERVDLDQVPSRRLTVVFDKFAVPAGDSGDIFTVESYDEERFGKDVPLLRGGTLRTTDTLDFRPVVSDFTSTTSSPFAFASRDFSSTLNPALIVAPEESSEIGYSFYLPRIDTLVLETMKLDEFNTTVPIFKLNKGISSLTPEAPENPESGMLLATISLPPYLYDPSDAEIVAVDNRRFTMRDIGKLEDRIENLETLTSLSLLELDTKTFQVQDADGLSRFKSGFFVDDFKNVSFLDISNPECRCDIDSTNQTLIAASDIYSMKPELALEPSINTDTADFSSDLQLLDSNIRKTGDLITLNYTEKEFLNQPLASRVSNVNPFNIIVFNGRVQLNPNSDNWTRNVVLPGRERTVFGDREDTFTTEVRVSSEPDTHIRSRNVGFDASGMKPNTRFYPFFDSVSGIDIVPKLLEISMTSGVFTIAETVDAFDGSDRLMSARICQPNHKGGNISTPTSTFGANPYDTNVNLATTYSASSTVLNIDINSLAEEAQGRFSGYVRNGITLVGRTSGAVATVANIRLITDSVGDVFGSFFFRDPLASPPPPLRFRNGTRTFRLTNSATNAIPVTGDSGSSSTENTYTTSGVIDTVRQSTVVVRRPPPPPRPIINFITNITQNITNVTNVIRPPAPVRRGDPLAQSFTVEGTGVFVSSVDLFFKDKDPKEKLTVELRTMELGTPTDLLIQDFATVTLDPSEVSISEDASAATRVTFPSPIYLEPENEYALCLLSTASNRYEAWVGRMGEKTITTQTLPDSESVLISQQYLGGSLFKSQNGTIWTPSQFEDLKFTLYRCDFAENTSGDLFFYNPDLNYESSQVQTLLPNAVRSLPRKLKVGITTVTNSSLITQLSKGTKVSEGTQPGPFGFIENVGGNAASITLANAGIGYSNGTFTGVPLYNITGNGSGATASVTVSGGVVSSVSVASTGNGYVKGDLLGITTSNVVKGAGAELTVNTIFGRDTLYLTNVQGEQFTDGQDLVIYNGNTPTGLANTDIRGNSTVINDLFTGNVLEVEQYNHGMQADTNIVELSNIRPTTEPIQLTAELGMTDSTISVANTTPFATFEGITTSTGYVQINNEVIFYDSIGSGTLGIGERGVDSSLTRPHADGSLAYKYEFNGMSLTGINTHHTMPNTALLSATKDIDKYYLEINRGARANLQNRATGDNQVSFTDNRTGGGDEIFASQNIQFNEVNPRFNYITPGNTSISSRIRTVSATSAGGSEVSFLDQNFEDIELNRFNKLKSTRMVASPRNEDAYLTDLPKNKSFTLAVRFETEDPKLSPVLDTMNGTIFYRRNRINKPIDNYALEPGANLNTGDPHASTYITRRVDLQQPATSLKVLVASDRHASSDFRVLYKLFRPDSTDVEQTYEFFPGYDNLADTDGDGFGDEIISSRLNSGRADAFVADSKNGEFKDYQFTIDDLPEFTGFAIKIVSSGTNEAYAPQFKDLRVIALA